MTSSLSVPNADFVAGTTIKSSEVDANFAAIVTWADAIPDGDLASPNNSAYKTIASGASVATAGLVAGTYGLAANGMLLSAGSGGLLPPSIYLEAADHSVGGLSTKLRTKFQIFTNATAVTSTLTFGLHNVTACAGGAAAVSLTLAAAVSGSTKAFVAPAASTPAQGNSTDFAIPADGYYVPGCVISVATTATNSYVGVGWQIQVRNV